MSKWMRRRGGWLLFAGLLALPGCGGGGSSGPFPELSPPVSSEPDGNGLVTQIRAQVARISDEDPLQVVLHFSGAKGPLTAADAIPVNGAESCHTLTFHVTGPDGKKQSLKVEPTKNAGSDGELYSAPTLFFALTRKGLAVGERGWKYDWQGGPAPQLESRGTYRISISGELAPGKTFRGKPVKAKPIPFASGVVQIERGLDGYVPLDEIARIARERVRDKLSPNHETGGLVYDDFENNRLVHLTGPSSEIWHYSIHTVQVSPGGKVLNVFSREVSNCLAEGTRLHGEQGPVAVEAVRVGDRLWGYDLERGVRVLTAVRVVRRAESNEVMQLGCGLRLTRNHPVCASGRWVAAGRLEETDRLLDIDGKSIPAGRIDLRREKSAVYDVTVDEPHNFFAGGVLVHNKSRPYWPHLDDLWYRLWSPQAK